MPANLTPEYRAAEAAFRQARDPRARLEGLCEMLRVIPKHKGTDHLQGVVLGHGESHGVPRLTDRIILSNAAR